MQLCIINLITIELYIYNSIKLYHRNWYTIYIIHRYQCIHFGCFDSKTNLRFACCKMVRRQESTDAAARLRQPTEMDQEKDRREQKICIIYIYMMMIIIYTMIYIYNLILLSDLILLIIILVHIILYNIFTLYI